MTGYPASVRDLDPVATGGTPDRPPTGPDPAELTARLADRSLLVVAPAASGRAVAEALSGAPLTVRTVTPPGERGPTADGSALVGDALADHGPVDGALLVVPRDTEVASAPGPVVDGVPVGVVRADAPADLRPWLDAVRPPVVHAATWAVLAMGKDEFLAPAGALRSGLRGPPGVCVRDWRADRLDRTALCRRLATGPSLAVYLGHGRPDGWSGYQALRWRHVTAVARRTPAGAVLALACDALAEPTGTVPFLERFVRTGRAGAVVGPVGAVETATLERVATLLGTVLRDDRPATVGALLCGLARRADAPLRAHLSSYRLVGSPLQPLR